MLPAWITHTIPIVLISFFALFGLPGCFDGLFSNVIIEGIYYYHPNQVGSVKFITNDDGTDVVARYHYDPYGSLLTSLSTGTEYSKYKYTAQESDDTTGLYYYKARFYDPAIGRFISADSIVPDPTDTQDFNRYMYASGNPIKCLDPTGHDSEDSSSYYPGWYVSLCNYINSSWFGSALAYVSNAISSVTGYYAGYNYPGITPPPNLVTANTGANASQSQVAENDGTGGPESTASKTVKGLTEDDEPTSFYYIFLKAELGFDSGSPYNPFGHVLVYDPATGYYYEDAPGKGNGLKGEYFVLTEAEFNAKYNVSDPNGSHYREMYRAVVNVPNAEGLRALADTNNGKDSHYNFFTNNCKAYAFALFEAGGVSRTELYARCYSSSLTTGMGPAVYCKRQINRSITLQHNYFIRR